MHWDQVLDPTYNEVTPGAVEPGRGRSIAASSTGSGRRGVTVSGSGPGAAPAQGMASLPAGNLVIGLVVFLALVAAVMFVVHKWGGDDDDFSNLRASAYNVLVVSLIAAVGLPVIKVGVWKLADLGVPLADHAAAWVLAA